MAKTRTAEQRARLVARWRASGQSRASFARRHGVSAWTLWSWSRKVAAPAETAAPTFVPVRVTADPDRPALEVVLTTGDRVAVRIGTPVEFVRGVVSALRSVC